VPGKRRYPAVGLGDLAAARLRKRAPLPPADLSATRLVPPMTQPPQTIKGSWGGGMAPSGPLRQRMPQSGLSNDVRLNILRRMRSRLGRM